MKKREIFHEIADSIDEGLIYVDKKRRFQVFNHKAKEITGIIFENAALHPEGKIENGDIVIITDNSIGNDDGNLTPEDLSLINIKDKDIKSGDALLAIGVYQNSEMKPAYKYIRGNSITSQFELSKNYLGFSISAVILPKEGLMRISVNNIDYDMNFLNSVGHIVIIDGKTGQVKFFQEKGYTVRKEALKEVLMGCQYLSKGTPGNELEVIGSTIEDIFEYNDLFKKMDEILEGRCDGICSTVYELNKRPGLCSIYPVCDENGVDGVVLKIRDLSRMEELLQDRNEIIIEMEKKSQDFNRLYMDIPTDAFENFVGNSSIMREVKFFAYKSSKTKFNVLITGESGTGKSQLAYEIHCMYNKNAPFVEVNCSAIAPNLIESELFGYVAGAFTGALPSGKMGYFEQANGGTIFLDEIGELPMEMQVKLLYVLQNKVIYRVGATKPTHVDIRIITATNQNLQEAVANGTFRQDLYYRINVFPICIPPLRERKSDLYVLINKILNKICNNYSLEPKLFSGQALSKIMHYNWPGNVRELENVIERAITLCDSNLIYPEHINIVEAQPQMAMNFKERVQLAEKEILESALKEYSGDKQKIIEELGISKSVFYDKLKRYDIK
ncbi:sigma-54 interaction domain-containing protein [Aminipila sp.]|uniref:sigma-54 interaction domain-containing protein n=1 Tax=Aminipila sp. TaxID=2060095 RepID=UPI0028A050A5|nr:sigma 54-interacting transcriptional regulator [Aminipila sp.]